MRRNRTVVILTVALVLALVAGAVAVFHFARVAEQQAEAARRAEQRADAAAEAARQAEQQALEQKRRAEQALYASQIALAQRAFENHDLQRAADLLDGHQLDLRGWEHQFLWSSVLRKPGVAFSPDGQPIPAGDDSP